MKSYYVNGSFLVAACDEELLGVKLEDREKGAVLYVDPGFYRGDLVGEEEAREIIRRAETGNLVGERVVSIAISENLVHPEAVLRIKGVPVAYFVKIK